MLKAVNKPLPQILLDWINEDNRMRLTLADVVFGVPTVYSGPEPDLNTQVSIDIPEALVTRHWIKYIRWDLAELLRPHVFPITLFGPEGNYPVSDILAQINDIVGMQITPEDISIGGKDPLPLVPGINHRELIAVPSHLMLFGSIPLEIQLIYNPA